MGRVLQESQKRLSHIQEVTEMSRNLQGFSRAVALELALHLSLASFLASGYQDNLQPLPYE
jgi:hypothetical protein